MLDPLAGTSQEGERVMCSSWDGCLYCVACLILLPEGQTIASG